MSVSCYLLVILERDSNGYCEFQRTNIGPTYVKCVKLVLWNSDDLVVCDSDDLVMCDDLVVSKKLPVS